MKTFYIASRCAVTLVLLSITVHAEPVVTGFEHFHAAKPSAEGGRLLYNELGCANCHGGDPELPERRGPVLAGITKRVSAYWLTQFLANPATARTGSTMPHFAALGDAAARDAVVQYLATLKPAAGVKPMSLRHVNTARGGQLFHTVGCVACHAPAKDFQPPDGQPKDTDFSHPSVAFPALREKYVLGSLVEFLRAPLKVRPDGRMPHTVLSDEETIDLAGYLIGFQGSDGSSAEKLPPFQSAPDLVKRGREIVGEQHCAKCHDLPKDMAATAPLPLQHFDAGCLEVSPPATVPRYDLSAAQRAALVRYLENRDTPLTGKVQTDLTLQALSCTACHERDGRGGPDAARKAYFLGDHNLGDTGRYPPPLTGIGRKLEPEWLAGVLDGRFRVRPYLQSRMPVYGAATLLLPALFAKADAKTEPALPGGDDTAGRKLFGTLGGLGCITCHRWGERPALGIQALDLSNIGQRLQPGWLHEYLINPAAHRPGTLMPSFWPGGKAANPLILDGDTDHQIASLYSFAKSANGEPEGFPSTAGGEFALVPGERPIVQRTFMEGVGTHAILTGFPSGTHLAYDGKNARPVLAWQGKFFDAYNTWFSRFTPFEKPLGESIISWPAASPDELPGRFDGFRLDPKGIPTFLWSVGEMRVEERFEGIENGLRRSIKWTASSTSAGPVITHPEGATVLEEAGNTPGQRNFTYSWK